MAKPAFITANQDTWGFKILFDGPDPRLFDLAVDLKNINTSVNTFLQEMAERRVLRELPEITMPYESLRNAGLALTPVFCCHKGFTEPVFRDDQETLNTFGIIENSLSKAAVHITFLGNDVIILQSSHCYKHCKIHDFCNILDEMLRFPDHPLVERIRHASEEDIQQFVKWVASHAPYLQKTYQDLYEDIQKALITDNWIQRETLLHTFAQFADQKNHV